MAFVLSALANSPVFCDTPVVDILTDCRAAPQKDLEIGESLGKGIRNLV